MNVLGGGESKVRGAVWARELREGPRRAGTDHWPTLPTQEIRFPKMVTSCCSLCYFCRISRRSPCSTTQLPAGEQPSGDSPEPTQQSIQAGPHLCAGSPVIQQQGVDALQSPVMSDLDPMDCSPSGPLCPWDSPGDY